MYTYVYVRIYMYISYNATYLGLIACILYINYRQIYYLYDAYIIYSCIYFMIKTSKKIIYSAFSVLQYLPFQLYSISVMMLVNKLFVFNQILSVFDFRVVNGDL